jgi:hypothetical protein
MESANQTAEGEEFVTGIIDRLEQVIESHPFYSG